MFFECFLELLFELSFVLLSKWSLTGNEGGKQGLIYIYLSAFRMPPFPIAFFNSWLVMSHFPVCSAGHVQLTLTVTAVHCTQYTVHSTQYRPVSGHSWARSHCSGYSPVARLAIVSAGQCQAVHKIAINLVWPLVPCVSVWTVIMIQPFHYCEV